MTVLNSRQEDARNSPTGWLRAVTHPELPQIRTCGFPASGSSGHGFATSQSGWTILGVGNGIRFNISS